MGQSFWYQFLRRCETIKAPLCSNILGIKHMNRTAFHRQWCFHMLIDRLFIVLRPAELKNLLLIWKRHHCRGSAAKFRPLVALRALEQSGIFIVPHMLWHGALVFPVSSEGPPIQSPRALTTHEGVWRIYSNLDPQRWSLDRSITIAILITSFWLQLRLQK
jgi:hypothetical protein